MDKRILVELTADIVQAHASVNEMDKDALLDVIESVYKKLSSLVGEESAPGTREVEKAAPPGETKPAVALADAFTADKVYCMICGKGFATLKKHLAVAHDLTPRDYRKKFDIPAKTPLVARNYSEAKKKLAKKLGLAEKLAEGRRKRTRQG